MVESHAHTLRINDEIPNVECITDMHDKTTTHELVGDSWAIMFSHPKDFTPVCTTEFGTVASLADAWKARNTKCIGVSVDDAESHRGWKTDIEKVSGAKAEFPIIADIDLKVAKAFNMLPAEAYMPETGRTAAHSATVRTVFIIGPDKKIKLSMTYPMSVGRNFNEVLRCLDAIQTTAKHGVVTPANWQVGDDVVIPPTVSNDDAKAKFGEFDTILPYLRKTKLPQ